MDRAIIVDDEQHCIEGLRQLLEPYRDRVQVVGHAHSVPEGIALIRDTDPDLLFLDVQIGKQTAFDLIQGISGLSCAIIFTTAYDRYAVDAFRYSALDYLLKPIEAVDLERAIGKVQQHASLEQLERKMDVLMHNLQGMNREKKITVPTLEGYEFLSLSDIVHLRSDANYTEIHLVSGKKLLVSKTLKSFEKLLGHEQFFRVHYSHLVNLGKVKKYFRGKGGYVVMEDNAKIEVSTRRRDEFLDRLKDIGP